MEKFPANTCFVSMILYPLRRTGKNKVTRIQGIQATAVATYRLSVAVQKNPPNFTKYLFLSPCHSCYSHGIRNT